MILLNVLVKQNSENRQFFSEGIKMFSRLWTRPYKVKFFYLRSGPHLKKLKQLKTEYVKFNVVFSTWTADLYLMLSCWSKHKIFQNVCSRLIQPSSAWFIRLLVFVDGYMTDEVKNLNRDFTSQDSRGLLEASSLKVSGLAVEVP